MTVAEFNEFWNKLIQDCNVTMQSKGQDYTVSSEDRFANFKEDGKRIGADASKVCWLHLKKHLRAIENFVVNGKVESEPIRGRFVDAINYLGLLAGVVHEGKVAWEPKFHVRDIVVLTKGYLLGAPGSPQAINRRVTIAKIRWENGTYDVEYLPGKYYYNVKEEWLRPEEPPIDQFKVGDIVQLVESENVVFEITSLSSGCSPGHLRYNLVSNGGELYDIPEDGLRLIWRK